MRSRMIAWALTCALASIAPAQEPVQAPGNFVPKQAVCTTGADGRAVCSATLPVADPSNASFASVTGPLTAGTDYAAQAFRAVNVTCSSAGTANLTLTGTGSAALPYTFAAGSSYQIAFALKSIDAVPSGCVLYGLK